MSALQDLALDMEAHKAVQSAAPAPAPAAPAPRIGLVRILDGHANVVLDHLRQVIGWRGYAQRDPLNEYKSEAFQLFEALLTKLRSEVTRLLAHVQIMTPEDQQAMLAEMQARAQAQASVPAQPVREPALVDAAAAAPALAANTGPEVSEMPAEWAGTGRNELCPCGSGKKFKHCHGQLS